MSFASTPLGQGRRLDHHTFHGKNAAQTQHNARQRAHNPPASYSYGASIQQPRSPPKPASSTSDHADDPEETALARYARLKQQQQQQQHTTTQGRVVGSRVVNTPPNPERWAVKDTSVNIASAFHRAATTTTTTVIPAYDTSASSNDASSSFAQNSTSMNHNDSWASGTQHRPHVARSTSVDYEKETQQVKNRALPKPESRGARPPSAPSRRLADRVDANQSAETSRPGVLNRVTGSLGMTGLASTTSYFMRRLSAEPDPPPNQDQSSSYDYSAEEKEFQASQQQQQQQQRRRGNVTKRGVPVDNREYNPNSDTDYESEDDDDVGTEKRTKRRKAKKNGAAGGPLTGFASINYDKKKRRRRRNANGQEISDEEEEEEEQQMPEERSAPAPKPISRRTSVPRTLQPPQPQSADVSYQSGYNTSAVDRRDVEEGLRAIPEEEDSYESEPPLVDDPADMAYEQRIGIGARVGKAIHTLYSSIWDFICETILRIVERIGDILAPAFGNIGSCIAMIIRGVLWIISMPFRAVFSKLGKYAAVAFGLYVAWWILNSGLLGQLSSLVPRPTYNTPYQPPTSAPPADISEISARLLRLENALASLSMDTIQLREGARTYGSQLGALESQLQRESSRVHDTENKFTSTSQGLQAVRQEVQALHSQIEAQRKEAAKHHRDDPARDDEARALLRALEERVGTVEGGVKEAIELGKNAQSIPGAPGGGILDWWGKLASGKTSALTIKTSDGKDVTGLISHLVDSAMSKVSKDGLARPDFAMYSGGASIIPSLTSETFEIRPQGVVSHVLGLVTGNGYAVGRPPVTALHHEIHNGHCWPFPTSQGQLGVMLSAPVHITDVTIDHVPREVATDMRTAPRQMELWGLVEGQDNLAKFAEWKARRREEMRVQAELEGGETVLEEQVVLPEEEHYPASLPRTVPYMRIADFTYNIYGANHVQTFAVPQEVQELGIDFGVVVLVVRSNWGRDEFTCLYRFRVHGERIGGFPEPLPEDAAEAS